jgi:hypothetical protein
MGEIEHFHEDVYSEYFRPFRQPDAEDNISAIKSQHELPCERAVRVTGLR